MTTEKTTHEARSENRNGASVDPSYNTQFGIQRSKSSEVNSWPPKSFPEDIFPIA
jgi:hypothetical protein